MTLQSPRSSSPSTSCENYSPPYNPMEQSPNTTEGDAKRCACRSDKLRVSFSFEISGGSLSWPSLPYINLSSGLKRRYAFSLYRFATLALILGLSIALIPLSIAQRNNNSGWYGRGGWHNHRGRYNYVCGLSVTSLLFTFVAVMADFIRFPSSAPLWLELGLGIAFSIMWLVCAILAVALHDANAVLAFINFGLVVAYTCALVGRGVWLYGQEADLWTQAVYTQPSSGSGIRLDGDDSNLHGVSGTSVPNDTSKSPIGTEN